MVFSENKAIYVQIADYVCEKILSDKWHENERILSVRELGSNLEVNPNTALRAYDFLQNLNIIENKRGIGYFVCESATEKIISIRKENFFSVVIKDFFKQMQLLNISFNEIETAYNQFINLK
jgi:DNA-binding transcriptional regulator YhcF (GntR family)